MTWLVGDGRLCAHRSSILASLRTQTHPGITSLKFCAKAPITLFRSNGASVSPKPDECPWREESASMSQLYDLKLLIEKKIKADGLDANAVRGKIGLQSGRMLLLIDANSKDDPAAVASLRQAIKEILNISA